MDPRAPLPGDGSPRNGAEGPSRDAGGAEGSEPRRGGAPASGPRPDDARLASVDSALSEEPLLPLPLDLVARVLAAVEAEPALAAPDTGAPRLRRFAWRAAAAAAVVALGAYLTYQPDALASASESVESLASWRLSGAEPVASPIADVLDAGRAGVRSVAGDVPALGSLAAVRDAGASTPIGAPTLVGGGAVLLGVGLALASARRRATSTREGAR